jgi:hypothetical protein
MTYFCTHAHDMVVRYRFVHTFLSYSTISRSYTISSMFSSLETQESKLTQSLQNRHIFMLYICQTIELYTVISMSIILMLILQYTAFLTRSKLWVVSPFMLGMTARRLPLPWSLSANHSTSHFGAVAAIIILVRDVTSHACQLLTVLNFILGLLVVLWTNKMSVRV